MCAVNWILKQIKQIMTLIKLICDLMENKDVAAYSRSPVSVNYTRFPWKVQRDKEDQRFCSSVNRYPLFGTVLTCTVIYTQLWCLHQYGRETFLEKLNIGRL